MLSPSLLKLTSGTIMPYISMSNFLGFVKAVVLLASADHAADTDAGELECCVCLSELVEGKGTRKLPCRHLFHAECVDRWLHYCRRTCPLCRLSVDCDPMWRADMELTEELGIWFSSFHLPGF